VCNIVGASTDISAQPADNQHPSIEQYSQQQQAGDQTTSSQQPPQQQHQQPQMQWSQYQPIQEAADDTVDSTQAHGKPRCLLYHFGVLISFISFYCSAKNYFGYCPCHGS